MLGLSVGTATATAPQAVTQPAERTLTSEVYRLSIKYSLASTTVMAVIKCESSMYGGAENHNKDAQGNTWSVDKGYLQINDYYHRGPMLKLGLNIDDKWDSLEYGFILMKTQGLKPWSASKYCWQSMI